jgi:hypothetical protein
MHYRRMRRYGTTDLQKVCRKPNKNGTPPKYKLPDNKPRELWLAWAAGFLDGEGTITLARGAKPDKGSWVHSRVAAVNCNRASCEIMQALFGGCVREKTKARNAPAYWRDSFYWQVTGIRATNAIKEMLPYLIIKRSHAEVLIDFQENRQYARRGAPVPEFEKRRQGELRNKLSKLNHRGK